jgi:predicted transcriptional regulator
VNVVNQWCLVLVLGLLAMPVSAQSGNAPLKPVDLAMEDQFEKVQSLAAHKGKVVILVYGDRSGTESSRELGTKLHVLFHPTAAGQTPAKARLAPVAPLAGLAAGKSAPDVAVVPVACAGKVPGPVKGLIRASLKKDASETPVWLDLEGVMAEKFGLREGEPNLVVFDAEGRLRLKINGTPDRATFEKLLQTTQNLRAEAAGLR